MKQDSTKSHITDILRGSDTLQHPAEEITVLHQRLEEQPDDPSTLQWLSYWYRELEHFQKATVYAKRSQSIAPDQLDASILLAANILSWNRHTHRLVHGLLRKVLNNSPNNAAALTWLGWARLAAGNSSEALAVFERSLEIDGTYPETYIGRGVALKKLDKEHEALANLDHAFRQWPQNHQVLVSLAKFHRRKQPEVAQRWYERAANLRPWKSKSRFSFGMFLLGQGKYERGWKEYEHFRRIPPYILNNKSSLNRPLWDGRPTDNTLLVYAEQGKGDIIQLARFLPWAAARASRLLLACAPSLHPLFSQMPIACECHAPGDLPDHDYWVPMFSLPRFFGSTLTNIPAPPYLTASPTRIDEWRTRLGIGFKVGVVWAGNPNHLNDKNRSIALNLLSPVFEIEKIRFFSLQVGERSQDIAQARLANRIVDLSPYIQDYHDTAAIVKSLDLVITVDTSVAHLAGALAVPVWLLLFHNFEWRWLHDREDSPWYPTMHIFRQPEPRNWEAVVAKVTDELRRTVKENPIGSQHAMD